LNASDALVSASIARARDIQDEAQQVSHGARVAGVMLATLVLLGMGLILYAARIRIYLPLLSMRQALAAFKSGRREWRVDREGALELRELATEFNDMAETLASQDARHLQFLAGVVHDLRSPLNVLKLSTQVLLKPAQLPPEEKVRASLTRILTQLGRLERMVGDLMDQTRVEAGNLELQWEVVDLRQLTSEVVELHRLSSQQHELRLSLPEQPVSMRCDPTRLSQVLTNLVGNAIKYSPQGGTVQVGLELAPEEVMIAVADEGVGIAPGDHERIFEPFQRSKRPDVNIPGIGLGLSVSRRIVRAHGGDIEVASREGRGSIFRVRLPSAPLAG
jgi:two-component system, OmpR family, sensor histidine kinase MtrB